MKAEPKNFLEKLQLLDESSKTKIIYVSTACIMAVIIYVWLAYFNNLISGIARGETSAPKEEDFSFWNSVSNGTAMLYNNFWNSAQGLGKILQTPREYIVQPK